MEHTNNNNISSEDPPPNTSTTIATPTPAPDRERNLDQSSSAPWTEDPAQMTCDVLCSLSKSMNANGSNCNSNSRSHHSDHNHEDDDGMESIGSADRDKLRGKGCPKQHQLPLFLSKTYHMIDRCDPAIATWASGGDNFVVKNVEKFASTVLPKYFKHSNFSSFARQLNFYGFRKLRTDPIINTDVDPRTACHVRFYHEHFQRDRPELLHHIKRATKSDQQSKDDVDSLRMEIMKLKDCITGITADFDRKLAEMSYEYNRRITSMSAEFDKLAVMVQQQVLAAHHHQHHNNDGNPPPPPPPPPSHLSDTMMHSLSQVAALSLQGHHHHSPHHLRPPTLAQLSTLTQQAAAAAAAAVAASNSYNNSNNHNSGVNHSSVGEKRYAEDEGHNGPATNRQRNG